MESENSKKARALAAGAYNLLEDSAYGFGELAAREILPVRELLTMAMLILDAKPPAAEKKPAAERKRARKKRAIARKVREKFSRPRTTSPAIAADAE